MLWLSLFGKCWLKFLRKALRRYPGEDSGAMLGREIILGRPLGRNRREMLA